jgi:hypothetical protein
LANKNITVGKANGNQFYLIKDGFKDLIQNGSNELEWKYTRYPNQPSVKITHDFTGGGDDVTFFNPYWGYYSADGNGKPEKYNARDALAVFDKDGKFVGATQLLIPKE